LEISEEARKNAQKLADAINKTLKEIDPTVQINPTPVMGILIMQFPADHKENQDIDFTVQGKICPNCAIKYIYQIVQLGVAESAKCAE
jgi:hypothetical protein